MNRVCMHSVVKFLVQRGLPFIITTQPYNERKLMKHKETALQRCLKKTQQDILTKQIFTTDSIEPSLLSYFFSSIRVQYLSYDVASGSEITSCNKIY